MGGGQDRAEEVERDGEDLSTPPRLPKFGIVDRDLATAED